MNGMNDWVDSSNGVMAALQSSNWNFLKNFNSIPWTPYYVMGSLVGTLKNSESLTLINVNNTGGLIAQENPQLAFDAFERLIG